MERQFFSFFFFFNDTATTEIYTLPLHDALPICRCPTAVSVTSCKRRNHCASRSSASPAKAWTAGSGEDRKSTRLNSSHLVISYAVFCLKKKKKTPLPFLLHTIQTLSHTI